MIKDSNTMNGHDSRSKLTNSTINDVNIQNMDGDTALHLSVRSNDIASLRLLFEKGADPNVQNSRGNTAFCEDLAFICDNDLTDLFFERNAKVDLKNDVGENALHLSIRAGVQQRDKYEFVKKLLEMDVDVNEANGNGETVAHLILQDYVTSDEIVKFMSLFVERGANVDAMDGNGKTPFYLAISSQRVEVMKYLLQFGVNIDGHHKCIPTFKTLENQDLEWFKYLIEQGARIDLKNGKEQTLLHAAINHIDNQCDRYEIVRLLVKKGVNITDRDADGYTALQYSLKRQDKDVFNYLVLHDGFVDVKNNNGESLLYTAISEQLLDIAKVLMDKGVAVNDCDSRGISVLFLSVSQNNIKQCRLLLAHGAKVDRTVLLAAVRVASPEMMDLIESLRLKIDHESALGRELFVTAVVKNRVEMVHYFLEGGADVNSVFKGSIPLKYAYDSMGKSCADDANLARKIENTSVQVLVSHIAVLKSLRLHVSHENTRLIDKTPSLKQWLEFCNAELEKMKTCRILPEFELTYYDLLIGYKSEVVSRMSSMICMRMLERSDTDDFYLLFKDYSRELEIGLSALAMKVLKSAVPVTSVGDILNRYGIRNFGIVYESETGNCRKRYDPKTRWFSNCLNKVASTYDWLSKTFTTM